MRNPILLIAAAVLAIALIASQSDARRRGEKPCVGPNCPTCPRVDVRTPRVDVKVRPVRIDNDCDDLSEREKPGVIAFNDWRAERGLSTLPVDDTLQKVARQRARYFDHHANGQWVWEAANRAGFKGFCTDNLAQGYSDGPDAVEGWGDPHGVGHDKQMMGLRKLNGRWQDFQPNCCAYAQHGRNHILIIGRRDAIKPASHPTFKPQRSSCPNCRRK